LIYPEKQRSQHITKSLVILEKEWPILNIYSMTSACEERNDPFALKFPTMYAAQHLEHLIRLEDVS